MQGCVLVIFDTCSCVITARSIEDLPALLVKLKAVYICSKSLVAKIHRLPVVLCQLTSTQQPSKRSDMQHSSLSRHLPSYPQSAPQLLSNRKARFWRNDTGNRYTTRCAAEEGLQFPKWPQQNFRRNLPTPQKLCGVKPKACSEFSAVMCAGSVSGTISPA